MSGAKIKLQHKIHVLTKKEELDSVRVQGKVVVVLDILFATTTMVIGSPSRRSSTTSRYEFRGSP